MFMFVQAEELLDTLEESVGLSYEIGEEAFERVEDNTPEHAAASASFIDDGIRFDFVSETPSGAFTLDAANALRSPEALPADALVLLSGVGVEEVWEELTDSIENLDPYTQEDFEDETGLDLERDLIDSLTGEIAFALLPSDLGGLFDGGLEGGVIEGLLLAGVQDAEPLLDAFDTFADLLEDEGIDINRDSLGEYEVVTASGDEIIGFSDYEPGYVVTDEWAVVGSNIDGLEAFYDAVSGETDTLGSRAEFRELLQAAPEPVHFFFYADLAGVLDAVEDALNDSDMEDYRREAEPFVEQLGSLMLAASITDARIHLTAAVTLRD